MSTTISTAVILGSTREGRLGDKVAAWLTAELRRRPHFTADLIDPLDFDLPTRHGAGPHPGLVALRQRLGQAEGFLVVVPEYNHGYPAALKFLIDSVGEPWQAKPVAFVSYGGISGGLRAVEQLRQVFAELHAVTIRSSVSFAGAWNRFDAEGGLRDPESVHGLEAMLKQLHWWALALREARSRRPYGEVAR
ncbi:MAG TPA: NAD(P)H-dependent oxidoreductase [Geminicoccus sp.]|jgi:NAD(P)H-dependent FMN reductase|uniref:NADPH-dependent FMN reductase n=1 Tax=Geminicoccus sp. TaxID=2024832 RepID=UPI002E32F1C2|nr:NAD(P)H-dependent oxidoreductase [Geminicoccus sp.]HEX2529183.1 NAD(P)H-dependent oxidoreductase [Geminicoccus sp.]